MLVVIINHLPPQSIKIVTASLEGWSAKAKKASSSLVVGLASLDTNPVF